MLSLRAPALMTVPESQEFLERSSVRHRQVQATDNRLVGPLLTCPPRAGVAFGEVLVRIDLRLFVTEELKAVDTLRCAVEVVDVACHVHHERTLGRDARRILAQGCRIAAGLEHVAQALEDGSKAFALPRPTRQAKVVSTAPTTRSSVRFRGWNRQQRELRHPTCLRLRQPATVPARTSAGRQRSLRASSRPSPAPSAAARLDRIPRLRHS